MANWALNDAIVSVGGVPIDYQDSSSNSPNTCFQDVGCTVVVYQLDQPVVLHNFFHLPISNALIAKRPHLGAYSIYLDTLVIAMQTQMSLHPIHGANFLIKAILRNQSLNGLASGHNAVTIATCRIPYFSENIPTMQDSNQGYALLSGGLNSLSLSIPDPLLFIQRGRELLSIGSCLQEHSSVQDFFSNPDSRPLEMRLDFHFILLFLLHPMHEATASRLTSFILPSPPLLPPINHGQSSQHSPFACSEDLASTAASNPTAVSQTAQGLSIDIGSILASDLSQYLTLQEITDSQYKATRKDIVAQVRNWKAMKYILTKFEASSDEDRCALLQKFSWRVTTYKHKTLWYQWALDAAGRVWKGEHPGVDHQNREEYEQWRGIVYLFKPNGAIDRNAIPNSASVNLDERWASRVTQTKLDTMRISISSSLT